MFFANVLADPYTSAGLIWTAVVANLPHWLWIGFFEGEAGALGEI
jgi:hypothetical protein